MYCPLCGSHKEPDELRCTICGYDPSLRPADERCLACGEPVAPDDRYCRSCGAILSERSDETSETQELVVEADLEVDPRALPEWLREFAHEQERALAGGVTESVTPAWLAATRGELAPNQMGGEPALTAARDPRGSDSDVLQLIDEQDLPEWLRKVDVETPDAPESDLTPVQEHRRRLPPPAVTPAWYASESIRSEPEAAEAFQGLAPALGRVVFQPATAAPAHPSQSQPREAAAPGASSSWLRRVLLGLVLLVLVLLIVYAVVLSR